MARGGNPLILFLAIGSGLIAFMLMLQNVKPPEKAAPGEARYVTVVKDVNIGSIIRKDDLDLLPASGNIDESIVFTDLEKVVGQVARRNLLKGQLVKTLDILAEGDNLASLIPKGYRAMTIPVSLSSNLSEMLRIGTRVDVILTFEEGRGKISSMTLVENARIIGISGQDKKKMGNELMEITLAVTPEGAETLAYAMKRGTLNVSIRSLSEEDEEKFFTLKELFFNKKEKSGLDAKPDVAPVPTDTIEIIRGIRREQYSQ